MDAATMTAESVTLVTQTRVAPGQEAAFAAWQREVSAALAAFPGYLDGSVSEPAPPSQLDWVIVQRFRTLADAQAWLQSPERQQLLDRIEPHLVGQDDIHIFRGADARPPDAQVSAVISTSVAPDREAEFRVWQQRIAAAEATFPGFLGAKVEPPIPGVQDDWATVVRFDTEEHLRAWLDSPRRRQLIEEARSFGSESRVRTVRGGFEGWFRVADKPDQPPPPAWKQNLVVLAVLYPTVFLLGAWIQTPFLVNRGVPFWLALFLSNAASIVLTGYFFIPWAMRALGWWLSPRPGAPGWTNAAGLGVILAAYLLALAIFSQFP